MPFSGCPLLERTEHAQAISSASDHSRYRVVDCVFAASAGEPPALNPFGQAPSEREDAVPGYIELSNGTDRAGMIYLTRDKLLQIYDKQLERQREIPLQKIEKDRIYDQAGMARKGVEVQGNHQRREAVHRPQLSGTGNTCTPLR